MKGQGTFFRSLLGLHDARSTQGIFARGKNVYNGGTPEAVTPSPRAISRKVSGNPLAAPVAGGATTAGVDRSQTKMPSYVKENAARKAVAPTDLANSAASPGTQGLSKSAMTRRLNQRSM
jgi:hypothetical protein